MLPWYATSEQLAHAFQGSNPAQRWQTYRALDSASRGIDGARVGAGTLRRRLYPEVATRTFTIPSGGDLDLYPYELTAAPTAVLSGSTAVTVGGLRIYPQENPPYNQLCLNPATDSFWPESGTVGGLVSVTGVWGYSADDDQCALLNGAVNGSATTLTFDHPIADLVPGRGSIVRCGTERMIVESVANVSTAVTVGADLGSLDSDDLLTLSAGGGALLAPGQVLLCGSERLYVLEVAGDQAVVERAWDGTTLAAHTLGTVLYAGWSLTVSRAALGTAAAAHSDNDPLYLWRVPAQVNALCIAEAMNVIQNELAAYGRAESSGDSQRGLSQTALQNMREQVEAHFGGAMWAGV